jgi:NADH:quinone reductase (non-electrogenic)
MTDPTPPQVVIIGAGFGGMETARRLAKAPVRITLIDRQNYHLFQPLLYQVAIAGLVPSQIAYPIRTIFRRQRNLTFRMGEVTAIDFEKRFIKMDGSVTSYDYLVLAVGGHTNFFGLKSVEDNAHEVKNIACAIDTRNHMLGMLELASHEADDVKRRALLTFIVAGGGPTGVETAGALAELIRHVIVKDYPDMDLSEVRVLLIEAEDHLMGAYPPELRRATFNLLKKKRVEILLSTKLADYDGAQATLADGRQIETRTLIWTAGVRANELADQLGVQRAAAGRIVVEETLQLPNQPQVFVLGDSAYVLDGQGQPSPMLATVAQQEARTAAQNIVRMVRGETPRAFRYKDPGLLATIGRNAAVARIGGLSFSGYPAWAIWVFLHIFRLIGFRNRVLVLINWAWDYIFYDNQVRLITRD